MWCALGAPNRAAARRLHDASVYALVIQGGLGIHAASKGGLRHQNRLQRQVNHKLFGGQDVRSVPFAFASTGVDGEGGYSVVMWVPREYCLKLRKSPRPSAWSVNSSFVGDDARRAIEMWLNHGTRTTRTSSPRLLRHMNISKGGGETRRPVEHAQPGDVLTSARGVRIVCALSVSTTFCKGKRQRYEENARQPLVGLRHT